jgi:hypothetical protein
VSAFDAALRGRAAPVGPPPVSGQMALASDWALDTLPKGEWRAPLAGNVGGQWRIQEVLSPDFVLDAACEAFGSEIRLDPCASSNPAEWFAQRNMSLAEEAVPYQAELDRIRQEKGSRARQKELTALLKPYYLGGALKCDWGDWRDDTYSNCPFGFLRFWLRRYQREARENYRRLVTLHPARPHRQWWCDYHVGAEVVFLESQVIFKGHQHAFPAALVLAGWNVRIPSLGKRETARWRP